MMESQTGPHVLRPSVLVVDDEAGVREIVALMLGDMGYRTLPASNGQEALNILTVEDPVLIILDLNMPVLDGPGFLAAYARAGYKIPIIVSSANRFPSIPLFGIAEVLSKPFLPRDLRAVIERVVSRIPA